MKQIRSWLFAAWSRFSRLSLSYLRPGRPSPAWQKVRVAIPTINVLTRPWYIAKDKGCFYAAEGLDPEFIYVQGTLPAPGPGERESRLRRQRRYRPAGRSQRPPDQVWSSP